MPIDPNIPLQAKGVQLESPANQLNMMASVTKLNEYQRGLQEQNSLRDLIKSGVDLKSPEARRKMYEISPEMGMKFEKSQADLNKATMEGKKLGLDVDDKKMDLFRQRIGNLAFNPSDNNVKAHLEDGVLNGDVTPAQAQERWSTISRMNPEQRKQYFTEMGVKTEERYKMNTISKAQQQTADITIRGQNLTDARAQRGQDITLQGQRMQYDPDLQNRIAEAKAAGDFIGKNKAAAAAALPGAVEAANEGIRLIDEMVGKPEVKDKNGKVITKGTAPHPGFADYVGGTLRPGMRFLEGSDAASFEVRQKQIEGKAFLEAFQALKGGGAITEKEGEKGTAAIMRMNKASNEKEYVAAARELQSVLRTGMERARTKAGNPAPSGDVAPPPAPSAGGSTVTIPGGKVLSFPTPEAAAAYKQAAGL